LAKKRNQRNLPESNDNGEPINISPDGSVEPIGEDTNDGREQSESASGGGSGSSSSFFGDGERIAGYESVNPGDIGNSSDATSAAGIDAPKRRGRKPGSKNAKKTLPNNLEGLEALLYSIHSGVAAISKIPEIKLEETECHELTEAAAKVAAFYPVGINPKFIAWSHFFGVCCFVYGPRFYAFKDRMKKEHPPNRPKVVTLPLQGTNGPASEAKPNGAPPPPTRPAKTINEMTPSDLWGGPMFVGVNDETE
jgi:hypothetical protein